MIDFWIRQRVNQTGAIYAIWGKEASATISGSVAA